MSHARVLFIEAEGEATKQALAAIAAFAGGMAGLHSVNVQVSEAAALPADNGAQIKALPSPMPPAKAPKRKYKRRRSVAAAIEAPREDDEGGNVIVRRLPRGELRKMVIEWLAEHELQGTADVAGGIGKPWGAAHKVLQKMLADGEVKMPASGRYSLMPGVE